MPTENYLQKKKVSITFFFHFSLNLRHNSQHFIQKRSAKKKHLWIRKWEITQSIRTAFNAFKCMGKVANISQNIISIIQISYNTEQNPSNLFRCDTKWINVHVNISECFVHLPIVFMPRFDGDINQLYCYLFMNVLAENWTKYTHIRIRDASSEFSLRSSEK